METVISHKILLDNARNLTYPFQIALPDGEEIYVEKALRIIPKKRITTYCIWNNKPVIAKIFFASKNAAYYAQRDQAGVTALLQANIHTPCLLYAGPTAIAGVEILIFEFLSDAVPVTTLWQQSETSVAQLKLLVKVLKAIARQHQAGLLQYDLHSGNFMISHGRVYSLDGDALKRVADSTYGVAKKSSIENISMLLAQFSYVHDLNLQQTYTIYASFRNWPVKDDDVIFLTKCVRESMLKIRKKFLDKTLRECSSFATFRSLNMRAIWVREQESLGFPQMLPQIEEYLTNAKEKCGTQVSHTIILPLTKQDILVKKYHYSNLGLLFKTLLSASSAKKAWINAHCLQLMRIPALKPLAICEKGFYPLFGQGYFLCEKMHGIPLSQFVEQSLSDVNILKETFNSVANILKKLAQSKITYGSMQACNFLMTEQGIVLTRFENIKQHTSSKKFDAENLRNIESFIKNWQDKPAITRMLKEIFEQPYTLGSLQN